MDSLALSYTVIELTGEGSDPDGMGLRCELGQRYNRTSVPALFINGTFIGGYNDGSPGLVPLIEEPGRSTLDALLDGCSPTVRK